MTPRGKGLWIVLTVLCSLSGCAAGIAPTVPTAPVIIRTAECPAPPVPALPVLDAARLFDSPVNVEVLLARDDLYRRYIQGLRATVRCYQAQSEER